MSYDHEVVMRELFGVGTPRSLQGAAFLALSLAMALWMWLLAQVRRFHRAVTISLGPPSLATLTIDRLRGVQPMARSSTGCQHTAGSLATMYRIQGGPYRDPPFVRSGFARRTHSGQASSRRVT